MKKIFFFLSISVLVTLFSCDDSSSLETEGRIHQTSYKTNGCFSQQSLNKSHEDVKLDWEYNDSILDLQLFFITHCSAIWKDSVIVENNFLAIYLRDTNASLSRCVCEFKEEFKFNITGYDDLNVKFYYMTNTQSEYELMLNYNINLM